MTQKFICTNPWTSLRLQLNGGHAPCCVTSFRTDPVFPKTRAEVMRLFNSPQMLNLRAKLFNNDLSGTPCTHCVNNVNFGKRDFSHLTGKSESIQAAIKAFESGTTEVDYFPPTISLTTNLSCNIRCVMCTQARPGLTHSLQTYPTDNIISILDEVDLDEISLFSIGGGETLHSRRGRALLEYFSGQKPKHTTIMLTTNGCLLGKYMDVLLEIPKLSLLVSVEGHESSYEFIRRGSKWTPLKEALSELNRRHDDIRIRLLSLLMRSAVADMDKLVADMSADTEDILFNHIEGGFILENIFMYPSLLTGLDWKNAFDRAEHLARPESLTLETLTKGRKRLEGLISNPSPSLVRNELKRLYALYALDFEPWMVNGKLRSRTVTAAERTRLMRNTLEWLAGQGCTPPGPLAVDMARVMNAVENPATGDLEVFRDFKTALASLRGRRTVIWGVGGMYRDKVRPHLNLAKNELVALADGGGGSVGQEMNGLIILAPEDLRDAEFDTVIIASFAFRKILPRLAAIHPGPVRVVLPNGVIADLHSIGSTCETDFIPAWQPA